MKTARLSLLFLLLSCAIGSAQTRKHPDASRQSVISFRLTAHNNMAVQAILNQVDTVTLMFHTAANSVTLTEEAIPTLKNLTFTGADTVKSWGGSGNSSRFSPANTLQIGGLKWENVPIWETKNSGPQTDGKFGTDLFANKVIEINFDKNAVIIHTELPARARKYEKLRLTFENDLLFLEAACVVGGNVYPHRFLIHSGYAGAVLLDDAFAKETHVGTHLRVTDEQQLKDSYGNVVQTKKATLPVFRIGKHQLTNVPVGFFEGAIGRQKMSVLGGDILKRFNLIIDAKREYIYLKPNRFRQWEYTRT
jgi:hypothetical protein